MADVVPEMHVIRFKVRAGEDIRPQVSPEQRAEKALALLVLAFKVTHQLTAQHIRVVLPEPPHNVRVK